IVGRQQLSSSAVEDVEKAVLGSVEQGLPHSPADLEVGEDHRRSAVIVPLFGGDLLIVPAIVSGAGIHCDDRAEEEIVAATRASEMARMRRAVTGAEIDDMQLGIVSDSVPIVASAASLPPLALPGLGGHRHDRVG